MEGTGQSVVAHACNPRYMGGGDKMIAIWSQHRQKINEILSQKTNLGVVVHVCNSSYSGHGSRKIIVWGQNQAKEQDLIWKIN
jgi:hypothetical protein